MSFSRYEVLIDGSLERVWGPSHALARAREVAQKTATKTRHSVRIDELVFERIGDPFPECDPVEFFDPPSEASDAFNIREWLAPLDD